MSPRVVCLHSVYDLTIFEMAEIMAKSNAYLAVGAFHYHSVLHCHNEGQFPDVGMCFQKYKLHGKTRIRMWFPNDMQSVYDHDYEIYLSHLRTFKFTIETKKGPKTYIFDIKEFGCDTIFLKCVFA